MLDWGIELSFTILLHEANNPGYFLNLWNVVDLTVSPTSPRCFLKLHVAWIGLTLLVTSGVNTQFPAREKICLSSKCIYEEYTVVILSNGQNWSEGNKNQNTQWWWWWDSDRDLAKKNQKLKIKNQKSKHTMMMMMMRLRQRLPGKGRRAARARGFNFVCFLFYNLTKLASISLLLSSSFFF